MTQELDLTAPILEQPYLVSTDSCDGDETTGAPPPILVLLSDIFMSACEVEIEQHVKRVKRRQTTVTE